MKVYDYEDSLSGKCAVCGTRTKMKKEYREEYSGVSITIPVCGGCQMPFGLANYLKPHLTAIKNIVQNHVWVRQDQDEKSKLYKEIAVLKAKAGEPNA